MHGRIHKGTTAPKAEARAYIFIILMVRSSSVIVSGTWPELLHTTDEHIIPRLFVKVRGAKRPQALILSY